MRIAFLTMLAVPVALWASTPAAFAETSRVTSGLSVLYRFSSAGGTLIRDESGMGTPLDLRIQNAKKAVWRDGGLVITGGAKIESEKKAYKIATAVKRSGEITLEAWVKPANKTQDGPARIFTISKDTSNRNVTLGQDKNKFDMRLRTTKTGPNGIPSLPSKPDLATKLTHVVFSRDRSGNATLYLNGRPSASKKIAGSFSNWDGSYYLSLGDETGGGRAWQGTLYLAAVYHRSLSAAEVARNFKAGARGASNQERDQGPDPMFATSIAPMLAENCFECHDSTTRQGGLDLTKRDAALAGGDSGKAIEPGKAESLLLQMVLENEMPPEREPLTDIQKGLLTEWVQGGASWTMDFVDPALFAHGNQEAGHWIQRLTIDEYIATVQATVDVDISKEAREMLPRDLRADGFSNTAYNLNVDLAHVEAYARLAEIIVQRMDISKFAKRFSKNRRFTDDDMGKLINAMGAWVLRGPLEEHEVIAFRGISTTVASAGGSYDDAVGLIVEAMLQSPRFIYRVENQVGDGSKWPVGEYELAARTSYILWGAPPDEELNALARSGDLLDPEVFDKQVERMLQDPRAGDRATQFAAEWLNLDSLKNLNPSSEKFPKWDAVLADAMRDETLAFFRHVAWDEDRPLSDLLSAQVTFATPKLAAHYNFQAKPVAEEGGLYRYDLSQEDARGGLLTHGSVLTIGGDEASMVTRGLFVLHDLLRGVVKDPPPCVDTTPVPTKPGVSQRTIATARLANEACGGCHAKFEPLAFGLERYDGLGAYFEQDKHGNELREDGEILFPGEPLPVQFKTSKELMEQLANSDRVKASLTWKVTQYAIGRPLTAADAPIVDKIHSSAQATGGSYRSLMREIVKSDLVQFTDTESSLDEAR